MDSLTPTPTQVDELEREAHARSTDPWTSHAAARKVDLTRRQVQVLEAFQRKDRAFRESPGANWGGRPIQEGLTDEEMVEDVHLNPPTIGPPGQAMQKKPSPSGLRTARKALADAGLLERAEKLRPTVLGNQAFVWVLTEAGRAFEVPQ